MCEVPRMSSLEELAMLTLLHEMQRRKARYGLATLCIAGGLGIATIIEKI